VRLDYGGCEDYVTTEVQQKNRNGIQFVHQQFIEYKLWLEGDQTVVFLYYGTFINQYIVSSKYLNKKVKVINLMNYTV